MNQINLKYGKGVVQLELPEGLKCDYIQPPSIPGSTNPVEMVNYCLNHPLAPIPENAIKHNSKVAIAINDKTRPVPHDILLPPLLDYLSLNGIKSEHITFFIANGTHIPMAENEFHLILPEEIVQRYKVVNHNCDETANMVDLGVTSIGTHVQVNREYFMSDFKIVVSNIEPHHFMGFSGGVKSAAIGLTSRSTINQNHAHLVNPNACAGNFYSNPCRIDVEEIGKLIGVNFALNAILNSDNEVVQVLWGDPRAVIEHGIQLSIQNNAVEVEKRYDHVIASAGGYPKDINLYQAQKAMTNAASITKDGGNVFLIAECVEGVGNQAFVRFLDSIGTPAEAMKSFIEKGFIVGPHKAFQIARIASRVNVFLISAMPDTLTKKAFIKPLSLQEFTTKLQQIPKYETIACMPYAVATIPYIPGEQWIQNT